MAYKRESNMVRATQNFDWADLENYAYKSLAYMTGNQPAITAAETAIATKKALEEQGIDITYDENESFRTTTANSLAAVQGQSIKDNIVAPIFSIFTHLKWIIAVVLIILLLNFLNRK